jgi:hypothetical protein
MPGVRNQQLTFGKLHRQLGKTPLFGAICATIVQRNPRGANCKGLSTTFGRQSEFRLILFVFGIAVKGPQFTVSY